MAMRSETGSLARFLNEVGPELEAFVRAGSGDAMLRHEGWSRVLDGPLPEQGVGAEDVVGELIETVIPNGGRFSEPGFWGWVTVGADTIPVVAALAGMVAAPQRYSLTAFNRLEELSLDWLAQLCGLPQR